MEEFLYPKYAVLFTIPQQGTYQFFKNIVLKNAIQSIFLGNAFLVLLLLISTTIWTEATLTQIDQNIMQKMLNINQQIALNFEQEFHLSLYELNMTRMAQNQTKIISLNDYLNCSISLYDFDPILNQTYCFYWYISYTNDLTKLRTKEIQQLEYFLQGQPIIQIMKRDYDTNTQMDYVIFPDTGLIIFNQIKDNNINSMIIQNITNYLTKNFICQQSQQCSGDKFLCQAMQKECQSTKQPQCSTGLTSTSVDLTCSENYQILRNSQNDYESFINIYNNQFTLEICFRAFISPLGWRCKGTDIASIVNRPNIISERFEIIFSDQYMNILYHTNKQKEQNRNQKVKDYVDQLANDWTDGTIVQQRFDDGFQSLIFNRQTLLDDQEPRSQKIFFDESTSYDSRSCLITIQIIRIPKFFTESLSEDQRFINLAIFMMSSTERFGIANTFFEVYAYLFFMYSSLEIIILMLSFYALAYIHKKTLITIVQWVNWQKQIFDQISVTPYNALEAEMKLYGDLMVKKKVVDEIQELSRNLMKFIWIVEFLTQIKNKKQDQVLLLDGIQIFDRLQSAEGIEIVYNKLINEFIGQKENIKALEYTKNLLYIHLNRREFILANSSDSSQDELVKLNLKIFNHLNLLLNLISKVLKKPTTNILISKNELKLFFKDLLEYADNLDLKFMMQIRILIKKSKVLYNFQKIYDSAQCLNQAQELLDGKLNLIKDQNSNENGVHDKKQMIILTQKIYYHKGIISYKNDDIKDAIKYFELSLQYGNVYYNKLKIKCLKMISIILKNYQDFEKDSELIYSMAYFFKKEKRDFYFLVDSTQKLAENIQTVQHVIDGVFNEQMKEQDSIKIVRFDEGVEELLDFSLKVDLMEQNQDILFNDLGDKLKSNAKGKNRCMFYACNQAIKELTAIERKRKAKYLIVFVYGENNYSHVSLAGEANEEMNEENRDSFYSELIDSLQNAFVHFILIGYNLKKSAVKRNKYLRLCSVSRRYMIIDLTFKNNKTDIMKEINNFFA